MPKKMTDMDVALSVRLKKQFLHEDRYRGEDYFASARVEIVRAGKKGINAIAFGSKGESYEVCLDFTQLDDGELGVYCECPRFADGENCKHLWALLLEVDKSYRLRLPHANELYLCECVDSRVDVGSPLPSIFQSRASRTTEGVQQRSKKETWREKLSALHDDGLSSLPSSSMGTLPLIKAAQYWFLIAVSDLADDVKFSIHVYQTKRKKDGDWGIPTKITLSRSEAESVSDPLTRHIFSLLDWDEEDSFSYRYSDHAAELRLSSELLSETLRNLCDTGRFVWSMEDARSLSEFRKLSFDDGGTWQFVLHVTPVNKTLLQVRPCLQRTSATGERQTRGIEKVVGVCDSGAILFEEQVGVLRKQDTHAVRSWQRLQKIDLPRKELHDFCQEVFSLRHPPELVLDDSLGVERRAEIPTGKLRLSAPDRPDEKYLSAEVLVQYGDTEIDVADDRESVWDSVANQIVLRDRPAELQLVEDLSNFAFQEVYYSPKNRQLKIHRKWFTDLVTQLTERGWLVVANGKLLRKASNFDIKVASGEDWFDLRAQVDFEGQFSSLPTLLKALQRGDRFVVLDDGSHGILPEEWLKKFAGISSIGEEEGESVRFKTNQALMLDMLLADQEQVTTDKSYSQWCKKLKGFSGVQAAKKPKGFRGELRDYQREGLGWLKFLRDFGFGGCLADDMGLGKTIQILALLESRRVRKLKDGEIRKPSLAVVPKSLVFNWIEEAARFVPNLKVVDYTGLQRQQRLPEVTNSHLLITTYATFRRDIKILKEIEFDYAIMDEAQAIKNPSAQATKAVRVIKSDHRIAMTGTPVENHLGDLWSLFDFLNPGMLGGSTAHTFTVSEASQNDRIAALSNALQPFILRRTKEQVLNELPNKTEQTLYCEMSPTQKKLYQELRDHYRLSLTKKIKSVGINRSKIHVLEALLRLRQTACDPRLVDKKQKVTGSKIKLLMEQLGEVMAEGHKALVFSQFTSLLSLLKQELDKKRWDYEYLDGKSTRRAESVNRFQSDDKCRLFLISLKAGGHGLNLTSANYVYILDPWWNPAVEAQAIDRAHRMGQQKSVSAYRIIAKETVEDKIIKLQQSKRELADAIITADQGLLRGLSFDDLQILFE
jgi:superfamily II DNA or RNA helicase